MTSLTSLHSRLITFIYLVLFDPKDTLSLLFCTFICMLRLWIVFPINDWNHFPNTQNKSQQVDLYACRDLDSRFTARERAAVDEWLSIDMPLHSMRDHPNHNTPLLGAAWGADLRRRNAREKWKKSWSKIFEDPLTYEPRTAKGPDQTILTKWVFLLMFLVTFDSLQSFKGISVTIQNTSGSVRFLYFHILICLGGAPIRGHLKFPFI